jgi:hypothetical protein
VFVKPKNLLATIAAVAIMLLQLLLPITLQSRGEMRSVGKGFPVNFVRQDITAIDFTVPHLYRFSSPWENPTELLWFGLIIDFTTFYFCALFLLYLLGWRGREGNGGGTA